MSETIELVTHCWAERFDIYATLLRFHLSSLVLRKNKCKVNISICYSRDDKLTVRVIDELEPHLQDGNIQLKRIPLTLNYLFPRAHGRNIAALETTADVLWFADGDYTFGESSLETAIRTADRSQASVTYPQTVYVNHHEQAGDVMIQAANLHDGVLLKTNTSEFVSTRYRTAIGGIQIIASEWCKTTGYLNGTKWVEPYENPTKFGFRCDRQFRQSVGRITAVDIPNVFRIRHTQKGYRT